MQKTIRRILDRRGIGAIKEDSPQITRILCFGNLELTGNTPVPVSVNWRTEKTRELFAYLLQHRNGCISKDRIMEAIWPDLDYKRASGRLHTTIYYLRKKFQKYNMGEVLQHVKNRYILKTENLYIDVDEFQQIADSRQKDREVDLPLLKRAVDLYRGDYLQEEFFEWAAGERSNLQRLYLEILKPLSAASLECKDYEVAVGYLENWLDREPLSEEPHCLIMEAYAGQGKRQQLISQFEGYKSRMQEELGVDSVKTVKTLFYELLNKSLE